MSFVIVFDRKPSDRENGGMFFLGQNCVSPKKQKKT